MGLRITNEQEVAVNLAIYLAKVYDAELKLVELEGDKFVYVGNSLFATLINVCELKKGNCIKIEQLISKDKGTRLLTDVMKSIIEIADIEKVKLGLWCEKDNKELFNLYSRLGFKYIETINDDWLEYN